ncbi:MAG: hypothetical protein E6Q84_05560, partial [Thiothrix sp.]
MIRTKYLVFAVLMIGSLINPCLSAETADETVTVPLSGQMETSIHRFGQASQRILWFSNAATQEADFNLAKQLARHDLEIWLTPLQAKSKKQVAKPAIAKDLKPAALAELIEASLPSQAKDKLYIFGIGESATAVLEGLSTWQELRGQSTQLAGLVLSYPHWQTKNAAPKLKLPIYLFQTTDTPQLEKMESLVTALE